MVSQVKEKDPYSRYWARAIHAADKNREERRAIETETTLQIQD